MPTRTKRPPQSATARLRGFSSPAEMRRYGPRVRNSADLAALPAAAQQTRHSALDVIAAVRRDDSLTISVAAKREGVSVDAVRFWTGDVVTRQGSRYDVAAADRLFRPMYTYSGSAVVTIDVRGSRAASTASAYVAAVQRFLRGDDPDGDGLARFRGVRVGGVELETDLDALEAMADRGEFDFDSIYRAVQP
jgi:hypothetical protein